MRDNNRKPAARIWGLTLESLAEPLLREYPKNMDDRIGRLKEYFSARDDISFALLFGSRASGLVHAQSDWDIAVYFRAEGGHLDLEEADGRFAGEAAMWSGTEDIVGASVDLVVLNRAPATLSSSALSSGILLACPDRRTHGRFELAASLLAQDEREFAREFAAIKARSSSLSEIDRDRLLRIVDFIETELADSDSFRALGSKAYLGDPAFRRNLERWVENLVNASIDAAKTLLASRRQPIPQTYRESLLRLATIPGFEAADCEALASFARLRNLLAHEYLDLRYPALEKFVGSGPAAYRALAHAIKLVLGQDG